MTTTGIFASGKGERETVGDTYLGALWGNEKQGIRCKYSSMETLLKNAIPSVKKIKSRMRYKIKYDLHKIEIMHIKNIYLKNTYS